MTPPLPNACTLYSTLEPCLMCSGALVAAFIPRALWLLDDDRYGALRPPYTGRCYGDHFARMRAERADEPDLAVRMRELWAAWRRLRSSPS